MEQNTIFWLLPGKQGMVRLLPGEEYQANFTQGLDGKFSYECWIRAVAGTQARLEVDLNGEGLCKAFSVPLGEAQWLLASGFTAPKGEHCLRICNTSQEFIELEGIFVSRDAAYLHSGKAECHRQRMLAGESLAGIIEEMELSNKTAETFEEKAARLALLSRMGFLERPDQYVAEGKCRCGVPLGGIGAGKIELDKDGVLSAITVNNNGDVPIYRTDGSFFAVWWDDQGEKAGKLLQAEGGLAEKLPHVKPGKFLGRFPRAELHYDNLPMALSLEAFSALVPDDLQNSSIPGCVFRFTAQNPNAYPITASLLFSWENLLGTGGSMALPSGDPNGAWAQIYNTWNPGTAWCNHCGNTQSVFRGEYVQGIAFATSSDHGNPSSFGDYTLLCPGPGTSFCAAWDPERDLEEFWEDFASDGELNGELKNGPLDDPLAHTAGAACRKFTLAAGKQVEILFVLAWHLPVFLDAQRKDIGVFSNNYFADSRQAAEYLYENYASLRRETCRFEELILGCSLPKWLQEKLINDRFPIYTCSWFTKDGKFSINEAPTGMMGCLGTMDQRLACNSLYTNFYPALDRTELKLFAAIQGDDGSIPHDLGAGMFREGPTRGTWSDLCSSFILQVYKYYTYTKDEAFLAEMFPRIKRAVTWQQSIDFDQNGIPDVGAGYGTTYDTYHWYGTSSFVASLWLCELKACVELAKWMEDLTFLETCKKLFEISQQSMINELWNEKYEWGSYYNNYFDHLGGRTSENCFIAQLAGQWFADLMDLGDLLPADQIQKALQTVVKRNILNRDMMLMNDETTPEGDFFSYGYTFVQYDEVYFGCLALSRGMVDEGLNCFERIDRATKSTPWNIGLTYLHNGTFSGLPYYMTNPASLFVLEALSGWLPDSSHGVLRIAPQVEKLSLPLFSPKLWVWLDFQEAEGGCQFSLSLLRGEVDAFQNIKLDGVQNVAKVCLNGDHVEFGADKNSLFLALPKSGFRNPGDRFTVTVSNAPFALP